MERFFIIIKRVSRSGSAGQDPAQPGGPLEDERMNWDVPLNASSTMIYFIRIGFSAAGAKCC